MSARLAIPYGEPTVGPAQGSGPRTQDDGRSLAGRGSLIARCIAVPWLVAFAQASVALELNDATRAQLEQLDGVGVAMAERVLNERAKAPFRDWDDLQRRVKGLRGARSARLRAQGVTVNGVTESRATRDDQRKR